MNPSPKKMWPNAAMVRAFFVLVCLITTGILVANYSLIHTHKVQLIKAAELTGQVTEQATGTSESVQNSILGSLNSLISKKLSGISSDTTPANNLSKLFNSLKIIGKPWGTVEGLTMFRGSPTRSWYGKGPVPAVPVVAWRYPERAMCMESTAQGVTKQWCGSGWTGQPVVWQRPDGITEAIFGAYDGAVHFVNTATGKETRPKFQTGDLIKGSVTLDPDGYPLLYFGSRDNYLRVIALDRSVPTELWKLSAYAVKGRWNDDWDGNPVEMNDMLFEGGENGWFFAMKLNRQFNSQGQVIVDPKITFKMPSYDDALINKIADGMVSIEGSVVFYGNRVYFANSGGRILGLDISNIEKGIAPVVFDYWVGDDTDATMVVDDQGMLYVAVELERTNALPAARTKKLGQIIKLNPYAGPGTGASSGSVTDSVAGVAGGARAGSTASIDAFVWGVAVPRGTMDKGGVWATPAIWDNYLYASTHTGKLLVIDRQNGKTTFSDNIGEHAWSSPVVVEKTLLVATCTPSGSIRQYSLANPAVPSLINVMHLPSGACIESTPAVWKGQILVGTRDGFFYKFADKTVQ